MLQAAEEIVGKYIWGQYDLLVMPPSFPYGGMENPCLTFVSPTLLVSYILPCYYDSNWACCNFKVMNWLMSSSSITGWWQISCKCKHSSNLHVSFTFSLLSVVTCCGRLCLGAFTFSELSSTHVFNYNGQSMNTPHKTAKNTSFHPCLPWYYLKLWSTASIPHVWFPCRATTVDRRGSLKTQQWYCYYYSNSFLYENYHSNCRDGT